MVHLWAINNTAQHRTTRPHPGRDQRFPTNKDQHMSVPETLWVAGSSPAGGATLQLRALSTTPVPNRDRPRVHKRATNSSATRARVLDVLAHTAELVLGSITAALLGVALAIIGVGGYLGLLHDAALAEVALAWAACYAAALVYLVVAWVRWASPRWAVIR